jgi:putative ABC transport system permease protein
MKAGDLAELAARNLREALLRNSLTTLGVGVGIASLVAMLSLGVGLQELATKRLTRSGLFDSVLVTPRSNIRGFGRAFREGPEKPEEPRPLDEGARNKIEALPNVVEVYPQVRFFSEIRFAGSPYTTVIAGVPESARASDAYDGITGRFFSGPSADEAILQIEFAKELSDKPATLIGKELVLRYAEQQPIPTQSSAGDPPPSGAGRSPLGPGVSFVPREKSLRIVGVIATDPAVGFGGFGGGRILIPIEVAQKLRMAQMNDIRELMASGMRRAGYGALTVRVKSPKDVAVVEGSIKDMGFSAFSLLDATKNLRMVFTVFDLLLGIFGSLALAVASLGIINTLVMAILERRREIGILKALGAADRDVKRLFFAEAGAMGLVGGILGIGMGWLIGRALTFGTNIYLARQNLPGVKISAVPWWLALGALAFAIAVSLAAGLYPASRAARLNPVDALRYE